MARINGNNFPNLLRGTSGSDIINGFGGPDALFGYAGNDILKGGSGNDYLDGGKGKDKYFGGGGGDVFKFKSGYGNFNMATHKGDIVMDYVDGVDRFDVPGSGLGAVDLQVFIGGTFSGTLVEYSGGSFFVKNYFLSDHSNNDFI